VLPVAGPDVVFAPLDQGAVLFSVSEEVYYGLNAVGLRVWQLLPPATGTIDELCTTLQREFADVDLDTIRADVDELLAELARLRLVVSADAA